MEKIGNLARPASQSGQQNIGKTLNSYGHSKKLMAALWERMTHIYGHRWATSFGEAAINRDGDLTDTAKTWATGLSGITPEQIATGLHACCNDASNEWPSLPMFKSKCLGRGVNEFGLDYIPEYYRTSPVTDKSRLLSSDERDVKRKKASEQIRNLKLMLTGKSCPTNDLEDA